MLQVDAQIVIGCVGVAVKQMQISREVFPIGYTFDLRVDPGYRRRGLGIALLNHVENYLIERGVLGVYGQIVSVNLPSLRLFDQQGYTRIRQVLYLEYPPSSRDPPGVLIECDSGDDQIRFTAIADRDFYTDDVAVTVSDYDYARWFHDSDLGYASLSTFDQSRVYRQIAVDDLLLPEAQLQQQARSLRIFHLIGVEQADLMQAVFDVLRDQALSNNYYSLSAVFDAEETLPGFIFAEAEHQKRYWMVFKSLHPDFDPQWGSPFYIDARDI